MENDVSIVITIGKKNHDIILSNFE